MSGNRDLSDLVRHAVRVERGRLVATYWQYYRRITSEVRSDRVSADELMWASEFVDDAVGSGSPRFRVGSLGGGSSRVGRHRAGSGLGGGGS